MKIIVKSNPVKDVNLVENDFICEGGEGKIYGKGDTIYKIYSDPSKMIPSGKIQELSVLNTDNILAPKSIITDPKGKEIGFIMRWQKDTVALCKLFTNDFRNRFNVTEDMVSKLVENTKKEIAWVHQQGSYLQVDGNEMNYLVDSKNFTIPKLIDVDSFKTPSFHPTAQMLSIKDFHTNGFSELTDWFAFAIVSCQLFIGIHPFKGTHPAFKKFDLEGRMKANVSIFNSDVRLPGTVRNLSTIPSNYKEWFVKLFERGERDYPPGSMGNVFNVAVMVPSIGSNHFDIEFVAEYDDNIIRYKDGYVFTTKQIVKGKDKIYLNSISVEIVNSIPYHQAVKVWIEGNLFKAQMVTGTTIQTGAIGEDKMVFGDSVFIKSGDKLTEYEFTNLGANTVCSVASSITVMPNSTKLFNGIVYQDVLGLPVFMIFGKSENKNTMCLQYRFIELKGYQVLEAKHEGAILIIVASKGGKFDTFVYKLGQTYPEYSYECETDTGYYVPNFTVLENGICICITPDDEVRIFNRRMDAPDVKVIKDPAVNFDMKLCKDGMKVMYRLGKKLYKLSIRK
jgi:hypothetical protein